MQGGECVSGDPTEGSAFLKVNSPRTRDLLVHFLNVNDHIALAFARSSDMYLFITFWRIGLFFITNVKGSNRVSADVWNCNPFLKQQNRRIDTLRNGRFQSDSVSCRLECTFSGDPEGGGAWWHQI